MKKTLLLIAASLILSNISFGQIDDVFKKVKKLPVVPDWSPEGTVTTSINDALPVVPWLGNLENYDDPQPVNNFNLGPGYYKTGIQTYCLHAGTYGPTEGSGYLISPLLGSASDLISSILKRSEDHPEIEQHDIQELLWGIEAGVKFTDYPHDFQARIQPLLKPEEIAKMNIDYSAAIDAMPDNLKDVASMYKDLRSKLVDPNASYQDMENIAVKNGIPPIGPGSKNVNPGNWSYMKDGFYIRTYPENYPKTFIEIYRPAHVISARDEKNRIISLENDGCKMEVIYDDSPGMDVLTTSGNPDVPIWRIKTIVLHGPDQGNMLTLDNYPGWIVKDKGVPIKNSVNKNPVHLDSDPSYAEYVARVNEVNQAYKDFKKYKSAREKITNGEGGKIFGCGDGDFDDNKQIHDGLKAALNPQDKKGQEKWIRNNLKNTTDWFNQASDALAGGTGDCDNNPHKFNPTKHVSTPGNTSSQRLAMSSRSSN